MPRQRLAPGEHGKITDARRGEMFYATTYVRLHSGRLREREASSWKSAEDARRELKRRIGAELAAGEPTGVINGRTTLSELFEAWVPAKIAEDRIGERTATLYRDTWRLHGDRQLGSLRIAELSTSRADAYLKSLPPSPGIYLRVILSGMFSLAVRFDVIGNNPIRETRTAKVERKPARALTAMEFEQVRRAVETFRTRKGPGPQRGRMLPATVTATCLTHDWHTPPHPGCSCGIYARHEARYTLIDSHIALQHLRRYSLTPPPAFSLVIAHLTLHGAHRRLDEHSAIEIRAHSATIQHLWLCEHTPQAPRLQATLRETFCVPVTIGRPRHHSR